MLISHSNFITIRSLLMKLIYFHWNLKSHKHISHLNCNHQPNPSSTNNTRTLLLLRFQMWLQLSFFFFTHSCCSLSLPSEPSHSLLTKYKNQLTFFCLLTNVLVHTLIFPHPITISFFFLNIVIK